jgi:hypothetical protein
VVEGIARKEVRPWRVIAEEASREYDAARMIKLIEELNQALQEQGLISPAEKDSTTERKSA